MSFIDPMLAHKYRPECMDPTGYWMSEKIDGVRAVWTGTRLVSRSGKLQFDPPTAWLAFLPADTPLDGELTLPGRGMFQDTVSIVRTTTATKKKGGAAAASARWDDIQYHVFDAPAEPGGFEARMRKVRAIARASSSASASAHETRVPSPIVVVEQVRCASAAQARAEMARIVTAGGEGIMFRVPESAYVAGKRSKALLKWKPLHDAEAVVVEHVPGKGKHKGRLGALRMRDGVDGAGVPFKIGTGLSDAMREAPPAVGAVVTYQYQERTRSGAPRFPVFLRERNDY